MLIEFRTANHRSLRDEQVLTMEAGQVGEKTDPRPRHVSGYSENLLTVAGLYGANASGKSNVLTALAFMCEAVLMSHRFWSPDEGLPRDPFAWGPSREEPSLFEVTFLVRGIRYQYGFQASNECFLEEWLYAWPHGKKQVWFERDGSTYKFGENLKGENRLIEGVTRPNALFLSAAVQHGHSQLRPVYSWLRSLRLINFSIGRRVHLGRTSTRFFLARMAGDIDTRQQVLFPEMDSTEPLLRCFRDWLRKADIGIVDLRVERSKPDDKQRRPFPPKFYLKHQSEFEDAWLALEKESHGTQTLFDIALPILQGIQDGGVLLVDELERSLHPSLAQQIIRQFNAPESNRRNAQIIFTTHDTNLLGTMLGEPVLRRDQVWLTEKDPEGATVLYPLTDYKPRKAENIERGYLQGRYGAIPFLGDFSVEGK